MKAFRVQQSHFIEKKAWVTVEADNSIQAIEKAKSLQWEQFEQRELVDQTRWQIVQHDSMSFFERLLFLFTNEKS
tara:strand:- start:317 stop:541 length:225 start_codon:yes stop_codon:yes gene_type:complete